MDKHRHQNLVNCVYLNRPKSLLMPEYQSINGNNKICKDDMGHQKSNQVKFTQTLKYVLFTAAVYTIPASDGLCMRNLRKIKLHGASQCVSKSIRRLTHVK